MSDDWKKATADDLHRQRADLDRLIAEAQRIRDDIDDHLERLRRGELPTRGALPEALDDGSRKPS